MKSTKNTEGQTLDRKSLRTLSRRLDDIHPEVEVVLYKRQEGV